jgi:regulator of RNase E activity RraA
MPEMGGTDMIEDPPKLTIKRPERRPTPDQIAAFKDVPTGFVVDAMNGAGVLNILVRPLQPEKSPLHVAGPGLTAGNGPADVMATFAALAFLQDGDVLVAATTGYQGCAAAGDRLAGMVVNARASGFVTDGPVRDYDGVVSTGLPIWCTGVTPATPFMTGPGTVGLPVQIAGQKVETGDMIVADRDGVVVVPFDQIDVVISQLADIQALENALDAEVAAGLAVPERVKEWLSGDQVKFVD